MDFNIVPVDNKADKLRFVKCQWNFYKNEPNWVPPIIAERLEVLDEKKNPFFKHSKIKLFLAKSGREIVGRIAAIINSNHNDTHNDKVGFFGFFECVDDQDVANALFDAAAEWLKENGMDTMRGPENPSQNDDCGLLTDAFDLIPHLMMPYNPEYYISLFENAGFVKSMDLYAYQLLNEVYMTEKLKRMQNVVRERYKVTIRNMSFRDKVQFRKDVDTLKEIYNAAWEPNWGFVKMTDEEFDHLAKNLKQLAEPTTTYIAEIDGKPIGFALGMPNINESLIHNKKGSLLGALWHILTKKKKIKTLRIIVLGVLPEYQKTGVDAVMFYEMGVRAEKIGILEGEASFILENNTMMNRAATQTMNGKLYKTYRLYDRAL